MKFLVYIISFIFIATAIVEVAKASNNQQQFPSCTSQDYEVVFGICNNNVRRKTYQKVKNVLCFGSDTLDIGENVDCTCTFEELQPIYADAATCSSSSNNATTNITITSWKKYSSSSSCNLDAANLQQVQTSLSSLSSPLSTKARCPCTNQDVNAFLSPCMNFNSYRTMIPYFESDCDSSSSTSPKLPSAQVHPKTPCVIKCQDGESVIPVHHISSSTSTTTKKKHSSAQEICSPVSPGKYSFTGKRWMAPYSLDREVSMKGIDTYCKDADDVVSDGACGKLTNFGWQVDKSSSSYFTTGDASNTDNLMAIAEIFVKIESFPATISFEYSMDTENYYDFFEVLHYDLSFTSKSLNRNNQGADIILRDSGRVLWTSVSEDIKAPELWDTIDNNDNINKITPICTWSLYIQGFTEMCLFPNQIVPYSENSFYSTNTNGFNNNNNGNDEEKKVIVKEDPFSPSPILHWSFSKILGFPSKSVNICENSTYFHSPNLPAPSTRNQYTVMVDFDTSSPTYLPNCKESQIAKMIASSGFGGVIFLTTNGIAVKGHRSDFGSLFSSSSSSSKTNPNFKISSSPLTKDSLSLLSRISVTSSPTTINSLQKYLRFAPHAGYNHKFVFRYVKDADESVGTDRVLLKNIQITGTSLVPQILSCPAGSFSTAGSSKCTLCGTNTFSKTSGSGKCTKCPGNQVSAPGSTSCVDSRACTSEDYYLEYSRCVTDTNTGNQSRTVSYQLRSETNCDINDASSFKPSASQINQKVSCQDCPLGSIKDLQSNNCIACASGQIIVDGDDSSSPNYGCHYCTHGMPELGLHINDFHQGFYPLNVTRTCSRCGSQTGFNFAVLASTNPGQTTPGLHLLGTSVVSVGEEVPNGGAKAKLEFEFENVIDEGSVKFEYYVENLDNLPAQDTLFEFSIIDVTDSYDSSSSTNKNIYYKTRQPITLFTTNFSSKMSTTSYENVFTSQRIARGRIKILFLYENNQKKTGTFITVGLHSITLTGIETDVGNAGCGHCVAGWNCVSGKAPTLCRRGSFAPGFDWLSHHPGSIDQSRGGRPGTSDSGCITAFWNNIVPAAGETRQYTCITGTESSQDSSYCKFPIDFGYEHFPFWKSGGYLFPPLSERHYYRKMNEPLQHSPISFKFNVKFLQGLQIPASRHHGPITLDLVTPGENTNYCRTSYERYDSYGCENASGSSSFFAASRSLGNRFELTARQDSDSHNLVGIRIIIYGENCHRYGNKSFPSQTHIDIDCDINSMNYLPSEENDVAYQQLVASQTRTLSPEDRSCVTYVKGKHYMACSLCSRNNIAYHDQGCDAGRTSARLFYYVDVDGEPTSTCYGGEDLPGRVVAECPIFSVKAGDPRWWIAGGGIVCVIVVIAVTIWMLVNKNRMLNQQFASLQNELGGEMTENITGGDGNNTAIDTTMDVDENDADQFRQSSASSQPRRKNNNESDNVVLMSENANQNDEDEHPRIFEPPF